MSSLYPLVTIGLPVFNGGKSIERAIKSIQSQTYRQFQVLISDNASTDATATLCNRLTKSDSLFKYVRLRYHVDAMENYRSLISKARTSFFVFIAADDYWEPDFLDLHIQCLLNNNAAVACTSDVAFEKNGTYLYRAKGNFEISGSRYQRLNAYFHRPSDNSRFYGVFRTKVLSEAFQNQESFHAVDWYIMALTLLQGDHINISKVLLHREKTETSKYLVSVKNNNQSMLAEYFPVFLLSKALLKKLTLKEAVMCFWKLFRINLIKHLEYFTYKHLNKLYLPLKGIFWFRE